jgi:hypothetical protein
MLSQQDVRFTFSRVDDSAFAVVRVTPARSATEHSR